ncbi:MAG: hypothetical protein ABI397_03485 [Candidatus Saccharimonas sp.]
MSEFELWKNIECEPEESKLDRELVAGRLRELGVQEDLAYLLNPEELDDNEVLGEIVTLATMYDLDIDDVLRETTPIEQRNEVDE